MMLNAILVQSNAGCVLGVEQCVQVAPGMCDSECAQLKLNSALGRTREPKKGM